MHSHPEEQWAVLLEGECMRIQGGAEAPMEAGDFWHTPGGVAHGIRPGEQRALVPDPGLARPASRVRWPRSCGIQR